jgi:hypothetical protein
VTSPLEATSPPGASITATTSSMQRRNHGAGPGAGRRGRTARRVATMSLRSAETIRPASAAAAQMRTGRWPTIISRRGRQARKQPVTSLSQGAFAFPPIEKIRGRVLNDERYLKRLLTGEKQLEASPNFVHDHEFTHVLFHPNKTLRKQGYNTNVLAKIKHALGSKKYSPEQVSALTSNGKRLGMDSKEQLNSYARGRKLALFPVLNAVDATGIMAWNDSLGRTANQQGFSRAKLPCGQMLFDYIRGQCVSCSSLTAVAGNVLTKPLACNMPVLRSGTSSDMTTILRKRYACMCLL